MSSASSRASVTMCLPAFSAAVKTAVTRAPIPESSSEASTSGVASTCPFTSSFRGASGGASFAFITSESIGRCGRRPLGRTVANTETVELEPRERVVPALLEVPERLRADGEKLVVGEVGDRATRQELDEQRVGRRQLQRAAHGAGVVRPGPAQREVQAKQGQRGNEGDRKSQEDAQVLGGVPAVPSAHLGTPPGLLDLVGDGGDLATDEGDAPEFADEAARFLDRHAGRYDGVRELAEVSHLAPYEQRERHPEDDPHDGDDVEEADQAHACSRERKAHAGFIPAPTHPAFHRFWRGNKSFRGGLA